MTTDDEWRLLPAPVGVAADWALWSRMPTAEVLSAVVLSLGIEPLKLSTRLRITEAERRYNRLGPKFRSRYTLACANVSKTGPLHPVGSALLVNGRGGATVSLPEFGAWAIGIGWELPERFPRCAQDVSAGPLTDPIRPASNDGQRKRWTPETLDELRAYRDAHGTKSAAKHFSISGQRLRQLLPSDTPPSGGFSAFNPGTK